ncbi:MAG: hypothetical protein BHW55_07925 [Candidatus Melainabacteria bacterium 35_41]|nr:MAG: hypothetical protein BHW55_07925 [Candidatus Melainabacteria bacterium 35_41]
MLSFTRCTETSVFINRFFTVAASSSFLNSLSFFSHKRWQAFFCVLKNFSIFVNSFLPASFAVVLSAKM